MFENTDIQEISAQGAAAPQVDRRKEIANYLDNVKIRKLDGGYVRDTDNILIGFLKKMFKKEKEYEGRHISFHHNDWGKKDFYSDWKEKGSDDYCREIRTTFGDIGVRITDYGIMLETINGYSVDNEHVQALLPSWKKDFINDFKGFLVQFNNGLGRRLISYQNSQKGVKEFQTTIIKHLLDNLIDLEDLHQFSYTTYGELMLWFKYGYNPTNHWYNHSDNTHFKFRDGECNVDIDFNNYELSTDKHNLEQKFKQIIEFRDKTKEIPDLIKDYCERTKEVDRIFSITTNEIKALVDEVKSQQVVE